VSTDTSDGLGVNAAGRRSQTKKATKPLIFRRMGLSSLHWHVSEKEQKLVDGWRKKLKIETSPVRMYDHVYYGAIVFSLVHALPVARS